MSSHQNPGVFFGRRAAVAGRVQSKATSFQMGVTLVEMLIVLVIAAILTAIAAPSFSSLINSTTQSSAIIQLVGDLNRARSEAIKLNSHVLVCARNAKGDKCDVSNSWKSGWLVCADENSDNDCDDVSAANPNPVVVLRSALNSKLDLTVDTADTFVGFNPNGSQGGGASRAILKLLGTWSGAQERDISIAATGSITK